jgi:ArsR family transcriptional regulator, lead/cadmium/zinc/bismuth-responsive transcriptional repressor
MGTGRGGYRSEVGEGPGGRHGHPVDAAGVARARERLPDADHTARLGDVLGLVADPTRARLLYALDVAEELCVGDLALALGTSEDAASYGLRVLRTAGLVTYRRDGRVLYYRLADGFPRSLTRTCLAPLVDLSRAVPAAGRNSAGDRAVDERTEHPGTEPHGQHAHRRERGRHRRVAP